MIFFGDRNSLSPRFFRPWCARYQQHDDGLWSGTYRTRGWSTTSSWRIDGCEDEREARDRLRDFVMR